MIVIFDCQRGAGERLRKNDMQIIATTHSLHLLERISELKKAKGRDSQFNTIYLKKVDSFVTVKESPNYEQIVHNLNVTIERKVKNNKIHIYTEDNEGIHFAKAILGRKFKDIFFPEITLGCKNLIQLGQKNIDSFSHPNSIVILDGDARSDLQKTRLKNYICLPGDSNPESLLARFLFDLPDDSPFWEAKIAGYSKQYCFKNYKLDEITSNGEKNKARDIAKAWYNEQLATGAWGRQACHAFKYYLETIPEAKKDFLDAFEVVFDVTKAK